MPFRGRPRTAKPHGGANHEEHADWTALGNHQCPNCPFSHEQYRDCPAAIETAEIAHHFSDSTSIERTDTWVHTAERSYFKNANLPGVVKSLFGLIMASGPCPILSRLKPQAHFHRPFAHLQETIHRITACEAPSSSTSIGTTPMTRRPTGS